MHPSPALHITRFAPTPSGFLHLGNVLSFVITAALAKQHNASILLRIDDLDQQRVRQPFLEDIFNTLHFLDLPWHTGPANPFEFSHTWSQIHRLHLYEEALNWLKSSGLVFACNCSRTTVQNISKDNAYPGTCLHKNLSLDAPGVCWRLVTNTTTPLVIQDVTGASSSHTLPSSMEYFIVRKKDGLPAYQLSSVVDDSYFGVNLVVRGADLWQSTLAQIYLSQLLPGKVFTNAVFHHHLLLKNSRGEKLSKSNGADSVRFHRLQGHTPSTVFTSLGNLLGYNQALDNWMDLARLLFLPYNPIV